MWNFSSLSCKFLAAFPDKLRKKTNTYIEMKTFRKILLIFCLGFFVFAIGFCGYYSFVTYDVSLQTEKLLLPDTQIVIYDETGQKVSGAGSFQTRDIVRIDTLPKYLPE